MSSLLLVLPISCAEEEMAITSTGSMNIGAIISKPADFAGKTVTVTGEYRGWEAGYGSPPVTRSDWIIKDETGGIYVTGKTITGLNPQQDRGRTVQVTGIIRIKDNCPYLEASMATLISSQ